MLKSAYVYFDNGHLRVKFELKTGGADQYGKDWHEISLQGEERASHPDKKDDDDLDDIGDGNDEGA
jgi:hypothetical protein